MRDLSDFFISVHFDDISNAAETVYVPVPEDCVLMRAQIQNHAVALTGGTTNVITFASDRGTIGTITMATAAESLTTLNLNGREANNEFQTKRPNLANVGRLQISTDGGNTSVNEAEVMLTFRRQGTEFMQGLREFALMHQFANIAGAAVGYIPIPAKCRVKRAVCVTYATPTGSPIVQARNADLTALSGSLTVRLVAGETNDQAFIEQSQNFFAANDRCELVPSGGTGSSEGMVVVVFQREGQDQDAGRDFYLQAKFTQAIATSEVTYLPIPERCSIIRAQVLSVTTHAAAATLTFRRTTNAGVDTALTPTLLTDVDSEDQATVDFTSLIADRIFDVGDRLEIAAAGGTGTSELLVLLTFKREG
jgi:hypothetical protein